MLDTLFSLIAPHPCCSCGKVGAILCYHCRYDIESEMYAACITCGEQVFGNTCRICAVPYSRAWCVGERTAAMQKLLDTYKFGGARSAYRVLANLLDVAVPVVPADICVVPVPTLPAHIRARGYDHTKLIAAEFAKQRRLTLVPGLGRQSKTVQRGANRNQRIAQARSAFCATASFRGRRCLLIDDVVTTGATVRFASECLLRAGAREVWVAAIARQPLD